MYFLILYIFYIFSTFFDTTDTLSVRTSGASQVYCTPTKTKMHSHLSLDASALSVLKISYWLLFLFLSGPYISADQHDQCDHCDDKWS